MAEIFTPVQTYGNYQRGFATDSGDARTTRATVKPVYWSPAKLFESGEAGGFYNFTDLSTLWEDTAGTTPATTTVARADDLSGLDNHIINATGGTTLFPIGGGGIQGDGSNARFLQLTGLNLSNADSATIMVAGLFNTDRAAFQSVVEFTEADGSGNGTFLLGMDATDHLFGLSKGTSVAQGAASAAESYPGSDLILELRADISTPSLEVLKNDAVVYSSGVSQGTGNYGTHLLSVGRRGNGSIPSAFTYYGLLVRVPALSAEEQELLYAYMQTLFP